MNLFKKLAGFALGAMCLIAMVGCDSDKSGNGQLSLRELKMDKYVTLGEYKGLEVTKSTPSVSEEDIEERMLAIIGLNLSEYGITDRPAKNGDRVVANLNCYIDGVAVTSASSAGETFVVGEGTMIEEIDEAFVGMSTGEVKNVEIVYPSDYVDSTFAGKKAILRLELVSIYPEKITDSMVASFDSEIYKTVDDLHKYCEDSLLKASENAVESELRNNLLMMAFNNAEFKELPAKYLEEEKQIINNNFAYTSGLYGVTVDEYVEGVYGMTVDQLAEKYLKQRMLIEAIAQKEGISYTNKSYNAEIAQMAEEQGVSVENYFLLNNITNDESYVERLTSDKVTAIILDNAIITQ